MTSGIATGASSSPSRNQQSAHVRALRAWSWLLLVLSGVVLLAIVGLSLGISSGRLSTCGRFLSLGLSCPSWNLVLIGPFTALFLGWFIVRLRLARRLRHGLLPGDRSDVAPDRGP
jgi:hypothetical protein